MYLITEKEMKLLIKLENTLASNKKTYDEFCILNTIVENALQRDEAIQRIDIKEE